MEKLLNVTLFPHLLVLYANYCDNGTFVTGEIIGFREKNLIAIHDQNANLVSGH